MRKLKKDETARLLETGKLTREDFQVEESETEEQHPLYAQIEVLREIAKSITETISGEKTAQAISKITEILDQQTEILTGILKSVGKEKPITRFDIKRGEDDRITKVVLVRGEK